MLHGARRAIEIRLSRRRLLLPLLVLMLMVMVVERVLVLVVVLEGDVVRDDLLVRRVVQPAISRSAALRALTRLA